MPIEIKELHIKINVDEKKGRIRSGASNSEGANEMLKACVEQVMNIETRKQER